MYTNYSFQHHVLADWPLQLALASSIGNMHASNMCAFNHVPFVTAVKDHSARSAAAAAAAAATFVSIVTF
jgi:hypothetical protein